MSVPTSEFITFVKDALENIYEPAHLMEHPLARLLLPARLPAGVSASQALHQLLLDNIEKLNPGPRVSAGSLPGRAYQILELRYVEALPFREVIRELGLSQAQYHRNLRQALQALAALLWEMAEAYRQEAVPPEPTRESAYHEAGDETPRGVEKLTDLCEIVRGVNEILRGIAADKEVMLREEMAVGRVMVPGDRTTLRQLIISLAGYVLAGTGSVTPGPGRGGQLVFTCQEQQGKVILQMCYQGRVAPANLQAPETAERATMAQQLLQSLGGSLESAHSAAEIKLTITLPTHHHLLLLIDDHPDEVQLITRLIADQDYTVLSASSVADGLGLARQARPDLILLDIMLPEQDGWDALQALKHDPTTQEIPVLVCTVLGESQLALALGASEFIRKPLTRPVLLQALARWSAP